MSVNLTPQKSAVPEVIVGKTDTFQSKELAIVGKTLSGQHTPGIDQTWPECLSWHAPHNVRTEARSIEARAEVVYFGIRPYDALEWHGMPAELREWAFAKARGAA